MEQHFAINALHTHTGARTAAGPEWDGRKRAGAGGLADGRTRRTETDHRTPKQEDPLIHDQISQIHDEAQIFF